MSTFSRGWGIQSTIEYDQVGLGDTITSWVWSVGTGGIQLPCGYGQLRLDDTIPRWVWSVEDRGYNHQVIRSATAEGNIHKVSMVSWDRRIQPPCENDQSWMGDTITKWVLSARAGGYYYQVSMVSLDWGTQSTGRYCQLGNTIPDVFTFTRSKDKVTWVTFVINNVNSYYWTSYKLLLIKHEGAYHIHIH